MMSLTSDMEQTVYVSAQTWGRKAIPDICEKNDNGLQHAIKVVNKLPDYASFKYGDKGLQPFDMAEGETVQIEVEWNFQTEAHPNDWSLTAFGDGDKGTLHLTDSKGEKSDSWRPTPRKDAIKKPPTRKVVEETGPDADSEAAFYQWLENLKIEGTECSMFKEDQLTVGD
jgi:hypothetical protein